MKKFYLAMMMAAAGVCGANAQLYFVGNFNSFDLRSAVRVDANADGNYVFTQAGLQAFKMSTKNSTEWEGDNGFNSGALGINTNTTKMNEPGTYPIEPWGEDQILPWLGDWTVTVNGAMTEMTITTTTPKPEGEIFYLRGSMNSWGSPAEWQFKLVEGSKYVLRDVVIPPASTFKVADGAWATINYGGQSNMETGKDYVLDFKGADCSLSGDGSFNGDIYYDLATNTILFEKGKEPELDKSLYIGYEGDSPIAFNPETATKFERDDTKYTLTLPNGIEGKWYVWNGTYKYMFAPNEGEDITALGTYNLWFGGYGYITYNTKNELTVTVEIPEDSYVDGATVPATITLTEYTGVSVVSAENGAPEYYNLQGVRVVNPEKGVYVVRQGNKVSKVVL